MNIGGKEAISLKFDDAAPFSNGLAPVSDGEKWGFINTKGEFIIDTKFDQAGKFNEGLAPVKDSETGLWGYIDKSGKYTIQPQFKFANSFENNKANVMVDIESNGMKLMTEKQIDKSGAFVN